MKTTPLVSVIIPVYNGANYMREAIDSALAQTYSNIEVIVVNDGSKDGGKTEEIALSYGDRIRYIKKENGGVSSALNKGIENMRGEYFSWLSHDDLYAPRKIEAQLQVLHKYGEQNKIVLCNTDFVDKDSKLLTAAARGWNEARFSWQQAVMYVTKHGANGCAFLIPRHVFEQVGGFDERLRYCQDILMWWKIFLNENDLLLCDSVGVHSRVHDQQLTQTGREIYRHDAVLVGDSIIPKMVEKSTIQYNFLFEYAKGEAIHGNADVAARCIAEGQKKHILTPKHIVTLKLLGLYGKIRPTLRKVYYRVFKKVKVQ